MPTDQKKRPDQAKKSNDGILNAVALLALPWLKFQCKMLEFMKAGIKNADNIKPFKALARHEASCSDDDFGSREKVEKLHW